MAKFPILERIKPSNLRHAIGRRGIAGTCSHAVRRIGTIAEKALVGPDMIRINPMGYVCNHACPMCWLQHLEPDHLQKMKKEDREKGMKLEEYVQFFNSIPAGLREVNVVGGGEPLVHREAVAILREIRRHGWIGSLISNCTLLKEETARAFIEMRWNNVRASVHAGDAETYQAIQGVDRFETLRTNLKTYDRLRREAGAEKECGLTIFHVLQHENIRNIDRLFAIAEEVRADFIEFDPIIPYDEGKVLSAEELRHARESLESCMRHSKVPCNGWKIIPELRHEQTCAENHSAFIPAKSCSVGFDQAFIAAEGNVTPCCFSDEVMGNVREQSFAEIWYGEKFAEFRNRLMKGKFAKYCITNRCTLVGVLHN